MTKSTNAGSGPPDPRIASYLDQLAYELRSLPEAVRSEVYDEIRQHIDDEVAGRPGDLTVVPEVLDRLGDPVDIAREAGVVLPQAPSAEAKPPSRKHEIWALFLLEGGGLLGLLAIIGHGHISGGSQFALGLLIGTLAWIVGLVLLWTSHRFTANDKLIGTLLVPGGFAGTLIVLATGGLTATSGQSCQGGETVTSVGVNGAQHVVSSTPTTCTGGGTDWVLLGVYLAILLVAVIGPIYTTSRLGGRISDLGQAWSSRASMNPMAGA